MFYFKKNKKNSSIIGLEENFLEKNCYLDRFLYVQFSVCMNI